MSRRLVALAALLVAADLAPPKVQADDPAPPPAGAAAAAAGEVVLRDFLVIPPVGVARREAFHTDAIEARICAGEWSPPKSGDEVVLPDGSKKTWTAAKAKDDGWLESDALQGGYAYASVGSESDRVAILDAQGHGCVYVNGEIRAGDPYSYGFVHLPVPLKKGRNDFLFVVPRGRVKAKLSTPPGAIYVDRADATLPNVVVSLPLEASRAEPPMGAAVVVNCTDTPQLFELRSLGVPRPELSVPAFGTLKAPFEIRERAKQTGRLVSQIALKSGSTLIPAEFDVTAVRPGAPRSMTYATPSHVQSYAVLEATEDPLLRFDPTRERERPALILSLHGAGVDAANQAASYAPKGWAHVVCPTNRRPYGFDWEEWGARDALRVLEEARRSLDHADDRVYLTGHSMGGHGTWQLGATYPDRFAAIGPSAGWASFRTYVSGSDTEPRTAVERLFRRAASPSDTLALMRNLESLGVYVLHGDADDNVPVSEARSMVERLSTFHRDLISFEQKGAGHWWDATPEEPGVDCVDWAPMMEFFARHRRPSDDEARRVRFTTACPSTASRCRWVSIEAQIRPLEPSSVDLEWSSGSNAIRGTTHNVARLLVESPWSDGPTSIALDGGSPLRDLTMTLGHAWLERRGEAWTISKPRPGDKGSRRSGPFKQVFDDDVLLVYGTKGYPEENAWAAAKARYDSETFRVRGNQSFWVASDAQVVSGEFKPEGNVVLYGNADTNAAWSRYVDDRVVVRRGGVKVGDREIGGGTSACVFVRPRSGSDVALVGVVGGTGLKAMRLTERLPYFTSGVGYPDLTIFGPEVLTKGFEGVRVAGFFGNDWSVENGEFVWAETAAPAKDAK